VREVHAGASVFIPAGTWISADNLGSDAINLVAIFPAPGSRTSCARHRLATEKKGTKSNGKGGGPVLLNVQHHLPIIPAILEELVGFDGAVQRKNLANLRSQFALGDPGR
jgi:hypothetical protein